MPPKRSTSTPKSPPKRARAARPQTSRPVVSQSAPVRTDALSRIQSMSKLLVIIPIIMMIYVVFALRSRPLTTTNTPYKPTLQEQRDQVEQVFSRIPSAESGIRGVFTQANTEMLVEPDSTDPDPSQSPAVIYDAESSTDQSAVVQLDLQGPWSCMSQSQTGTASIMISDRSIKASLKTATGSEQALLTGDCIDRWDTTGLGQKQCGVGQYLPLIEPFLGNLDLQSQSMLGTSLLDSARAGSTDVKALLSSCKKSPIDPAAFTVPTQIPWEDAQIF